MGAHYSEGLRFSCARCSSCCRYDPGYVFLSVPDVDALAARLGLSYSECVDTYCRWIPVGGGVEHLSLKERSNFDCIFWKEGCTVYEARPLQCRTFPFWASTVESRDSWEAAAADCPGIGSGDLHDASEIDAALDARERQPIISRVRR